MWECDCRCIDTQSNLFTLGKVYEVLDIEYTYAIKNDLGELEEIHFDMDLAKADLAIFQYI